MSLIERFKSPNSVIQFLDSADGRILVEYFQEMKEKSIRQIRKSNEPKDIFYAQGAADSAELVSDLKKDILKYLDDVRTGKIKPASQVEGKGETK